MVDSNDRERIGEARDELMRMLAEDELREAVLLIFANKQVSRGLDDLRLLQLFFQKQLSFIPIWCLWCSRDTKLSMFCRIC